jgi:DNA repair protein RecN (Recombination protein N)
MLKTLYIKGYALIDELSIEFGRGLNIITGETGAGKSILIDALSLILGERSDVSMIRKGAEKAIVEAQFDHPDLQKLNELFKANEIDASDDLILRREISLKGQSRCFINDTPATISVLKQVGDMLVDLHGQHEHQSLLRAETHIDMLDNFGNVGALLDEYRAAYRATLDVLHTMDELQAKEHQLAERRELYEYQIKEIDDLSPEAGEEDRLETELKILENSEHLHEVTERLYQSLYEGENAVNDQLVIARNQLEDLAAIDNNFEESKKELNSALAIISELAKFVQAYNSKIEFNPERLEEIRTRLGKLTLLKKKYGGSLDAVLSHREKIGKEVALAQNFQEEIAKLQAKFVAERKKCSELAFRLTTKRQEAAKKIEKGIVQTLAELGIAKGRFEVKISNNTANDRDRAAVVSGKEAFQATPNGIDDVEFYISTNVGEDVKPLVKVASGGEVSRIMLSLKKILSKTARLPLMIFDEIDTGVSGRIGQAVGKNLKNLSQFHQVIAITHLPQIAGFADLHYVVEKSEEKKRVSTSVRKLQDGERVVEVARLMSGETVTDAALQGARELIGM